LLGPGPRAYAVCVSAKILVIDDERFMRDLMRLHLEMAGYEVMLAYDAVVGGRFLLAGYRPDLILVDIEMPHMSGLEFITAVKSDPATASIPIIVVSSRDDAELEAKQMGAAEFLTKPVRADQLLGAVANYIEGRVPL
jgi:chemosensory pili system protein ChpA (sensor histidine kinase/response regulator)